MERLVETGREMQEGVARCRGEFTEISRTIEQLSESFEELAAQPEELNAGSQNLEELSDSLRGIAEKFKVESETTREAEARALPVERPAFAD